MFLASNKTYNKDNSYNADNAPTYATDGQSVFTLNGDNCPARFDNCTFDGGTVHWGFKATSSIAADNTTPIVINTVVFNNCIFKDGLERAYDQVRGGNVIFNNCKWINTGIARKRVTTSPLDVSQMCDAGFKGGVWNIKYQNCSINDVLLGDYTIYDQLVRPKTRGISFDNCTNPNGGPIIVRGWYVDPTTIYTNNTNVHIEIHSALETDVYFNYNKHFGDNRKGIPGEFVITPVEYTSVTNPFVIPTPTAPQPITGHELGRSLA